MASHAAPGFCSTGSLGPFPRETPKVVTRPPWSLANLFRNYTLPDSLFHLEISPSKQRDILGDTGTVGNLKRAQKRTHKQK